MTFTGADTAALDQLAAQVESGAQTMTGMAALLRVDRVTLWRALQRA